jgi:hypothetical protein
VKIEAGRVYKAMLDSVQDQIIMGAESCLGIGVVCAKPVRGFLTHGLDAVEDARPLILLDLFGMHPSYVVKTLRESVSSEPCWHGTPTLQLIANQIEAQTEPAKLEEPGLWGVVTATLAPTDEPTTYVRETIRTSGYGWVDLENGCAVDWTDLINPTLIRAGVTP